MPKQAKNTDKIYNLEVNLDFKTKALLITALLLAFSLPCIMCYLFNYMS